MRLVAGYVARSVAYLFNESFRIGKFPSALKVARLSPLFKGGDSTDFDSQRAISVLLCLSKVYESIRISKLQEYVAKRS